MIETSLLVLVTVAFVLAAVLQGREFFQIRWCPTRHTAAALAAASLPAIFSTVALAFPQDSLAYSFTLWVLIFGLCGFAIPWAYVLLVEHGSPAALGIHRDRWVTSLVISLFFAGGSIYGIVQKVDVSRYEFIDLVGTAFSLNVGGLFELFLYYGFLHLHLRKAFGALPAVIVTAAIYSLWHIGTELPMHDNALEALVMLFVIGIMCQLIFATTYNCLVIWPFFFTAGVMHDFIVHLDLPEQVSGAWGWSALGWTLAIVVPWSLWRFAQRRNQAAAQS